MTTESFEEWWRADDDGLRGTLLRSALAISLGGSLLLVTGLSERVHFTEAVRITSAILGTAALMFGLVTGFVTMPRLLFSDHYIGVGQTALHLSLRSGAEELAWDDIVRIYEREGAIVIEHKDLEERTIARRFGGKSPAELAVVLEQARMKSAMKL